MPDLPNSVLITRALSDSQGTVKKVTELGFLAVCLPLTKIEPVKPLLGGQELSLSDAFCVTSANAIYHAPLGSFSNQLAKPCFCVGEKTAQAARNAGFSNIHIGAGDAQSLGDLIAQKLAPRKRITYLTGRVRRSDLEVNLERLGYNITLVSCYDTKLIGYTAEELNGYLSRSRFFAVLVYSQLSAEGLSIILKNQSVSYHFEKSIFYCISKRVSKAIITPQNCPKLIATKPNEASLLHLLKKR